MISSLLMQLGIVGHDATAALTYFGANRTQTGEVWYSILWLDVDRSTQGVTIPSQKRFVGYYASRMTSPLFVYSTFTPFAHSFSNFFAVLRGAPFPLKRQIHLHKLRMFTVPNFDIGGGCGK